MNKLPPCPFCRCPRLHANRENGEHWIVCDDCGATAAIEKWNKRPLEAFEVWLNGSGWKHKDEKINKAMEAAWNAALDFQTTGKPMVAQPTGYSAWK